MPVPCHFLLVDDNAGDRMLALEAFEQLCPDCTLTTAAGGREALDLLRSETFQPDVILLDLNMPGMSGFEFLQELKQDPALRKIPVVMLTTSSAQSDVTQAYTLHASSYLVKSSAFDTFLEQVETFLKYWQANSRVQRVSAVNAAEGNPAGGAMNMNRLSLITCLMLMTSFALNRNGSILINRNSVSRDAQAATS